MNATAQPVHIVKHISTDLPTNKHTLSESFIHEPPKLRQ